jgi:phosphatidate phosphatase APP1
MMESRAIKGAEPLAKERISILYKIEDRITRFFNQILIARGRIPVIHAFTSYGSTRLVRILGRAVMAKRYDSPLSIYRGIKSLFVARVSNVEVEVKIDGQTLSRKIRTDNNGYIDANFRVALPAGEHQISLSIIDEMYYKAQQDSELSKGKLLIYPPSSKIGIICDLDDTIIRSDLFGWVRAIWLALFSNPREREPVQGMNRFLMTIQRQFPSAKFFFVSTTAWNMSYYIKRFLVANHFPFGPLVLRDWGFEEEQGFTSGEQHKLTSIRSLFERFPGTQWILIGDNGQSDCRIYADILSAFPHKVRAIFIRQIRKNKRDKSLEAFNERVVYGPDGYELRDKFLDKSKSLVKILK